MTVLEALVRTLKDHASKHGPEELPPICGVWTDKDGLWQSVIPLIQNELCGLMTLGAYTQASNSGPAIWIRSMLAGTLDMSLVPPSIVYLPRISRDTLRNTEDCPRSLQPLVELQYRGSLWSHPNGKDWTPVAFLLSLGMDVASDEATRSAVQDRLTRLLQSDIEELKGLGRLDSHKIRNLGSDWPSDILNWMQNPSDRPADWNTFQQTCKASYGFDPEADGELVAAEKLAEAPPAWVPVWRRFSHAPKRYPKVVALLRQVVPPEMFARDEGYPTKNAELETAVRDELSKLAKKDPETARKRILELEREHQHRRDWVWSELGESSMANALQYLSACAKSTSTDLTATSVEEFILKYTKSGFNADLDAWQAYASVDSATDIKLIGTVIRVIYLPWLESAAVAFAKRCEKSPLMSFWAPTPMPEDGECIVFADGLRYDIARMLHSDLLEQGALVDLTHKVCALPSVTPTAKPAVSPISDKFSGNETGAEFRPTVGATGTGLLPDKFKQLLAETGVLPFGPEEDGDCEGKGWTESGAIDRKGHDDQASLARRLREEVHFLSDRIRALLDSGWKKVRVVTDHGWLWMPGGLPKTELPAYLTDSKWGRCASLKEGSTTDLQVVPWHWNQSVSIVLPVGISCFKKGQEYSHGGLSVQECVVPVLVVTSPNRVSDARIDDVKWVGLKCAVKCSGGDGLSVDIRTKPADASTTILYEKKLKVVQEEAVTLFADDRYTESAAVVVLIDVEGRVVAKLPTTVGG